MKIEMNLEKAKNNLKEYVSIDAIYQDYLQDPNKIISDYDIFCVEHCEAINTILKENELIEAKVSYEINKIWKDKIKIKIEELKQKGYWTFLEEKDLEKTIDLLQSLMKEN